MLGQDPVTYRRSITADRFPCDASDQANDLSLPLPSTTKSYSSQCDIAASLQALGDNVCRHAEPLSIPPEHRRHKGPVDGTAVLGPPSCPFLPPSGVQMARSISGRELPWRTRVRRAVAPPSQDDCRSGTASVHPRRGARHRLPCLRRARACRWDLCHQLTSPPPSRRYRRSSSAAISARSVTVRPSSAMSTAPSYKVSIALTLPELNRSISDGTTPSGSVGSE